ncbi:tripartite tricarboxylate transporter TctB family protein [Fusibacter bizertensis]
MLKTNVISSVIFIIIGAIFIKPSLDLGLSSATSDGVPGAGFFPFIMSFGIILLGLYLLVTSLIKLKRGDMSVKEIMNKINFKNTVVMFLIIVGYVILWNIVGYYIATFMTAVFANWYFKRSWIFTIGFSSVFVLLIYVIFTVGLKIQFVI